MKKKLLIIGLIILSLTLSLFIIININININSNKNKLVIDTFNNLFKETNLEIADELSVFLPKQEINGTDYIGVINIEKSNLLLPVESKCSTNHLSMEGACHYSNNSFTILGTNLKNSFHNYKTYSVFDTITFTNTLGESYQYKVKEIKKISNLNKISEFNEDLIIIIKNYYSMEYTLFIC